MFPHAITDVLLLNKFFAIIILAYLYTTLHPICKGEVDIAVPNQTHKNIRILCSVCRNSYFSCPLTFNCKFAHKLKKKISIAWARTHDSLVGRFKQVGHSFIQKHKKISNKLAVNFLKATRFIINEKGD